MSLQETMGGQGLELSPVTVQVLGILIPLFVVGCLAVHVRYVLQALRFPERIHEGRLHLVWRPVHWSMVAWLLLVFLLANLFLSAGAELLAKSRGLGELEKERLFITLTGLGSYLVVLLAIGGLFSRYALRWRDVFGCRHVQLNQSLRGGLGFFLGSFPVCWLASVVAIYALYHLGVPLDKQEVFKFLEEPQPTWFYWILGFVAVIGAPVVEELVFRGLLLPVLSKFIPIRFAVLVVSALFAAIHLHLLSFFPLFILAIYLSLAMLYFRTIIAPIVMHMVFNAVNLCLFLFLRAG